MIRRKIPFTSQPQSPVALTADAILSVSALILPVGGGAYEVKRGLILAGTRRSPSPEGRVTGAVVIPRTPGLFDSNNQPYTLIFKNYISVGGNSAGSVFSNSAVYATSGIYHGTNASGYYSLEHWNGAAQVHNTFLGANNGDIVSIRYDGTNITLALHAARGGITASFTAACQSYNVTANGTSGVLNGGTPSYGCPYFLIAQSYYSNEKVARFINNPWQILLPQARNIFVSVAALDGTATDTATATGALTTAIQVVGAAAAVSTATGALSTGMPLAGTSASVSTANGALSAQIKFDAAALSVALATGALDTGIALDGSAAGGVTGSGSITTQITLSGAAVAEALATAALTTSPSGLSSDAVAMSTAGGALTTQIPLAGAASAISISTGGLTTGIPLAGAAASVSHVTGDLTVSITMSAAALAQAAATGSLSTLIQLSASALSVALATGVMAAGASSWLGDTIRRNSAIRKSITFNSAIRKSITFNSAI